MGAWDWVDHYEQGMNLYESLDDTLNQESSVLLSVGVQFPLFISFFYSFIQQMSIT